MAVRYHVSLAYENGELVVTRTFDEDTDRTSIPVDEISPSLKRCQHFDWNRSDTLSQQIGSALFKILNGNNLLIKALRAAELHGEPLQLFIEKKETEKSLAPDLPFELLYDSQFLVPSKIHLIRHVSDYGSEKKVEPQNRPLKVLFLSTIIKAHQNTIKCSLDNSVNAAQG